MGNAAASDSAAVDKVSLFHATTCNMFDGILLPWKEAREVIEKRFIGALPPHLLQAHFLEPLVRNWLRQARPAHSLLSLDGWPVVQHPQRGLVRVTIVEQLAAIPADIQAVLDEWVLQNGCPRDRVRLVRLEPVTCVLLRPFCFLQRRCFCEIVFSVLCVQSVALCI